MELLESMGQLQKVVQTSWAPTFLAFLVFLPRMHAGSLLSQNLVPRSTQC